MNGVIFHDLSRPLTELYRPLIIHLEANGNNHLKIIVILAVTDLTFSLGLNCQVFLDSCLRCKLAIRIDPIDVLRNRLLGYIIHRCHTIEKSGTCKGTALLRYCPPYGYHFYF